MMLTSDNPKCYSKFTKGGKDMPESLTLTQWRRLKGLSQRELAELSGISERSIWEYEKNNNALENSSYATVKKICRVLEIEPSQIFLDNTSVKPK